ncbi:MAG TPA: pyridoxamine 5'-phosphate oxidase [Gemmatimonadales bacterium]|jgi:pyridoxamine 5'-phosphate oxidase|nr:pyridoxamine 5'-phosphate oxidase [Gemmatimonadales bacterium]
MNLADLRREYAGASLDERSVDPDPLRQFLRWLAEAGQANLLEPNAMTLATVSAAGAPSARVVLLKEADERGLVFYTDTRSRKGVELAQNPRAALTFWWAELGRQVRIEGTVAIVATEESEKYYRTRPEGSRISAWASHQSSVVPDRATLERRWDTAARRYPGAEVPRPPYWGGYRVTPREYEFWQGRPNRLHDRIRYRRGAEGGWVMERLSP